MTEHSKIPVPPTAGDDVAAKSGQGAQPGEESLSGQARPTLIERVVRNYDLVKLNPAPIPDNLIPPVSRRPRYRRAAEQTEVADGSPVNNAVAPAQKGTDPAPAALRDAAIEVAAPQPAVPAAAQSPAPVVVQPVQFIGKRHDVSRQHLREQGLIVPEGSVTGLQEEFRIVKRQLLLHASSLAQQGMGEAARRILICSPHPGEGKTYTSVNLALAIAAEKESEVVLVDADFAKPSVLSSLGLPGGPGLMDALADPGIDVADCVIGTDISGLWVLPAGNATTTDSEYLSSSHTRTVLNRLTQGASNRIIIFDSPPALAASPAAELAKYVGQAVLVARADRTGQGSLEDAIKLLSACPNIQLLLNAVHFSPSGRRFGSYYGYGG